MRELFSFIFDRLTDPLGLPIAPWKEWIIMLLIGAFAFGVAYRIVGAMYRSGDISSRAGGSLLHRLIRLVVFAVMWAVTYGVICIWQFFAGHWVAMVGVAGGLLVSGIIVGVVIHSLRGATRNA